VIDGHWLPVRDGDERALALYLDHYSSAKSRGRVPDRTVRGNFARFVGPGQHLVLLTVGADALFIWRNQRHRKDSERGVECTVFRNAARRSRVLSSLLIREACALAWARWVGARLFTFVDPGQLRSRLTGRDPGHCFLMAGWCDTGRVTPRGLRVLECWA
jgi:hypothetical protein